MKKQNIFFILFLAAQLLTACAQEKHFTMTILHTNDTHSQIDPCNDKGLTDVGGVERRSGFINEVRATDSCVLLLDAGDFSQGTPYFNLFHGRLEIQLMNMMGYDAGTLGNHEFDNGLDTLAERIKEANFPIVCANYKFKNRAMAKYVKPYAVIEKCGIKIGVFGLTPNVEGLASAEVCQNALYQDPIESAQYAIKELKKQKVDLIICLSHLGYSTIKPTSEICDTDIAKQIGNDIDILIGGHTHTCLETADIVNEVPIVQTGRKGVKVGKITISK
ncbi:MAG: metallophosphatase [Bacteroidales bacterium]|nr:metallophosphatase [Bacteroidales bacterium]